MPQDSRTTHRAPHGWAEIKSFYGWNPAKYLRADGRPSPLWEDQLVAVKLPLPLRLSFAAQEATRIRFHPRAAEPFRGFLYQVHSEGLWDALQPFGGGYEFRRKRTGDEISMHGLGAAIDGNPKGNPQVRGIVTAWTGGVEGRPWAMPDRVVEIARVHGLTWGGDFDDPMHFQFGSGY